MLLLLRNDEGSPFPPPPGVRTQPSSPILAQKIRWIQSIGFMPTRRMSAAALSAAVDSLNEQETAPTFRRNQVRRKANLKRQPLFGRGGLGERRFSQRSGLSPSRLSPTSFREGARGRGLFCKKSPLPRNSHAPNASHMRLNSLREMAQTRFWSLLEQPLEIMTKTKRLSGSK